MPNSFQPQNIVVAGAGIFGLWQALHLARAGHRVEVREREAVPFAQTASRHAGAMIAPYCEAESAPPIVRDLGLRAARIWRDTFQDLVQNGSIVLAGARDRSELRRFARMTTGYSELSADQLADLEPGLAGRFASALYFPNEAHMTTPMALRELLNLALSSGARASFGTAWEPQDASLSNDVAGQGVTAGEPAWVIDCRGIAARQELRRLRGVRGERLVLRAKDVQLQRPIRLLHPRHPLYVVPWTDSRFLVGATVIESEDDSPMTARSALELLGLAYALHPGFGEAEILEMGAGVRPSLPDNVPRVFVDDDRGVIRVNGAYRHGFLLGPVMAEAVGQVVAGVSRDHPLIAEHGEPLSD